MDIWGSGEELSVPQKKINKHDDLILSDHFLY